MKVIYTLLLVVVIPCVAVKEAFHAACASVEQGLDILRDVWA